MHLCHRLDRGAHCERALFGVAGDIGGRLTFEAHTQAVENEYRRATVLSLDYVPGLRDPEAGSPARQRRGNHGAGGIKPPLWRCRGSNIS